MGIDIPVLPRLRPNLSVEVSVPKGRLKIAQDVVLGLHSNRDQSRRDD
jgi:hypothetical protein